MSFIKLDKEHQDLADTIYKMENQVIELINAFEGLIGKDRWFSIGRTDIEKGFMALRKGIKERYKCSQTDV